MIWTTAKTMLVKALENVPEIYRSNRQYQNAGEFLKYGEFGLALDSFLELANETEGVFPVEYWEFLAEAAEKMKLAKEAALCKSYIDKTKNL